MNIIILEDLKGFRKTVEVAFFPPDYSIAEVKPLSVRLLDISETLEQPLDKIIRFYPKGESQKQYGVYIWLYKQME